MKSFRWEIEPSLLTSVIWDETRGSEFSVFPHLSDNLR